MTTRSKDPTRKDAYHKAATVGEESGHVCRNFDCGGSNPHYVIETCKECGKTFKTKKTFTVEDPSTCLHVNFNNTGSTKSTHRIACADCGIVLFEEPQSIYKARGKEAPGFEDKNFRTSRSSAPASSRSPLP